MEGERGRRFRGELRWRVQEGFEIFEGLYSGAEAVVVNRAGGMGNRSFWTLTLAFGKESSVWEGEGEEDGDGEEDGEEEEEGEGDGEGVSPVDRRREL